MLEKKIINEVLAMVKHPYFYDVIICRFENGLILIKKIKKALSKTLKH